MEIATLYSNKSLTHTFQSVIFAYITIRFNTALITELLSNIWRIFPSSKHKVYTINSHLLGPHLHRWVHMWQAQWFQTTIWCFSFMKHLIVTDIFFVLHSVIGRTATPQTVHIKRRQVSRLDTVGFSVTLFHFKKQMAVFCQKSRHYSLSLFRWVSLHFNSARS